MKWKETPNGTYKILTKEENAGKISLHEEIAADCQGPENQITIQRKEPYDPQ